MLLIEDTPKCSSQCHGAHRRLSNVLFSVNGVVLSASAGKNKPEASFSEAETN